MFAIPFPEIRCWFSKNFKLALGINGVTRNSLTFFTPIQNKKQQNIKLQFC